MAVLGMRPYDELIKRIEALADPDPDSDWKYGKDYGIMVALSEIEKYREENEANESADCV